MTGVYFTPAEYAQFDPNKHKQTNMQIQRLIKGVACLTAYDVINKCSNSRIKTSLKTITYFMFTTERKKNSKKYLNLCIISKIALQVKR